MKKYELIFFESSASDKVHKFLLTKLKILLIFLIPLIFLVTLGASVYYKSQIENEVSLLKEYEPEHIVARKDVEYHISKLEEGIRQLGDADRQVKEIFQMPFMMGKFMYSDFVKNNTEVSLLNKLFYADGGGQTVSLVHLRRFTRILDNEYVKRLNSSKDLLYELEIENILYAHTPSIWPTQPRVTSNYGFRKSPFTGVPSFHEGTDLAATYATPVLAGADGIVVFAGTRSGYGYLVTIDHGFGYMTRYAHNSKLLTESGDFVRKGDVIALSGSTGRSAGPHLHYEVLYNGTPLNSAKFLPNEGK